MVKVRGFKAHGVEIVINCVPTYIPPSVVNSFNHLASFHLVFGPYSQSQCTSVICLHVKGYSVCEESFPNSNTSCASSESSRFRMKGCLGSCRFPPMIGSSSAWREIRWLVERIVTQHRVTSVRRQRRTGGVNLRGFWICMRCNAKGGRGAYMQLCMLIECLLACIYIFWVPVQSLIKAGAERIVGFRKASEVGFRTHRIRFEIGMPRPRSGSTAFRVICGEVSIRQS
jgi:hypothetical protein